MAFVHEFLIKRIPLVFWFSFAVCVGIGWSRTFFSLTPQPWLELPYVILLSVFFTVLLISCYQILVSEAPFCSFIYCVKYLSPLCIGTIEIALLALFTFNYFGGCFVYLFIFLFWYNSKCLDFIYDKKWILVSFLPNWCIYRLQYLQELIKAFIETSDVSL